MASDSSDLRIKQEVKNMYCPLLCMNPDSSVASFGQCKEEACAWWIITDDIGKCAICQLGEKATNP